MEQFNIEGIIERYNLSLDDVQNALFPQNRYKKIALDRVLKGETKLNTTQLQALANLAGVLVSDLFNMDSWSASANNGTLTFKKGPYTAKVNHNGSFITLYKDEELIDTFLANNSIKLSEFINFLNSKTNESI
jgi:hypothetical protein